jgi:preprotein translocase subunit SecD
MDRSLKWRFGALLGVLVFCAATLASSVVSKDSLPSWFNSLFSKKINLGLDLQGGMHIVYSIDLDKAVDDKATELKRDFEARFTEKGFKATVKTPAMPLGAVSVLPDDPAKRAEIDAQITADYDKDTLVTRDCGETDGSGALCYKVSSNFADSVKKSALANAVSTIRERINEKGVADPSVVEKGDDIIVELPGDPDDPVITETKDIIARTAKLEFKVVDDCDQPDPKGCTVSAPSHLGSPYMKTLWKKIGQDKKGNATDPEALAADIKIDNDQWKPEGGGAAHRDYYILAYDRDESISIAEAKLIGCFRRDSVPVNGKLTCSITGRHVIERYINGVVDKDGTVVRPGLVQGPDGKQYKVPDDHQIGFELIEPQPDAKDQRRFWRTYYLERAVRLTGTAVSNAYGNYDPSTNKPLVLIDFNRYGGRVFGDITTEIVGMKLATILDDKVKSAPLINQAITGGKASITMGGSDPRVQEKERDDLVNVLKTGSLPAPLHEESENKLGPTLGADAIEKTRLSFAIGILLVVVIMVGVYRWSGTIAVFAVVFHIVMTLAVMAIFGATLTLPGIAAIVLSIGMEVDGNILIYERIRDELLLGKSVRGAIDLGFSRAFSAILDGQLTTAAAGWVLLQYGSGPIKGFAVMLLVGVFTTLTTNIWVTRIFFDWTVARKKGQLATISI